jgi:integrase
MPRKRTPWSRTIEESGVSVRIYEREIASLLYREVRLEGGRKDRRTLGHRNRALAADQARALAKRVGEIRNAGVVGSLTLGQLELLFAQHRHPVLSDDRRRAVKGHVALLLRHFGRDFPIEDLSQHHVDAYVKARRSGSLKSARHRVPNPGVRSGTIRNELHTLGAMLEWAQGHKVGGRRLLTIDPLAGIAIPAEPNMRRPVATEERYRALLEIAGTVDSSGRFRLLLAIARHTGRRRGAICALRAGDVLLTREQLLRGLGAAGLDLAFADHWTHGAIRWSEASDKLGYEAVTPIAGELRKELDAYMRVHPRLGDAPLVPMLSDPARHVGEAHADYWMRKAARLAKLPKLERGQWHTLRRLWASERRHLPPQDVAAAGGWRSLSTMRSAYQQADAATIFRVIDAPKEPSSGSTGHTLDSPKTQDARAQ